MNPGDIIHIAGATLEVVSEQLVTCERVRTVDGKVEHFSYQYTSVIVRDVKR